MDLPLLQTTIETIQKNQVRPETSGQLFRGLGFRARSAFAAEPTTLVAVLFQQASALLVAAAFAFPSNATPPPFRSNITVEPD